MHGVRRLAVLTCIVLWCITVTTWAQDIATFLSKPPCPDGQVYGIQKYVVQDQEITSKLECASACEDLGDGCTGVEVRWSDGGGLACSIVQGFQTGCVTNALQLQQLVKVNCDDILSMYSQYKVLHLT